MCIHIYIYIYIHICMCICSLWHATTMQFGPWIYIKMDTDDQGSSELPDHVTETLLLDYYAPNTETLLLDYYEGARLCVQKSRRIIRKHTQSLLFFRCDLKKMMISHICQNIVFVTTIFNIYIYIYIYIYT